MLLATLGVGVVLSCAPEDLAAMRSDELSPSTQNAAGSTSAGAIPDQLLATFEGAPPAAFGGLSGASVDAAFGSGADWTTGLQDLAVVNDSNGTYLQQRYVPTNAGSPVVSFPIPIAGGPEVWLSYRVYFAPGWEWAKGGKLPGLAGGTYPTGGKFDDNGFSARLMWREDGTMSVYAYHQDRRGKWGEDFFLVEADGRRWQAPVGQWFTITERIKMNTTGETYDGEVEVWIDSVQRLRQTGLRWRKNTSYTADAFLYSSFYGGSDASWAPSVTTYAFFDDFKVASARSGVE